MSLKFKIGSAAIAASAAYVVFIIYKGYMAHANVSYLDMLVVVSLATIASWNIVRGAYEDVDNERKNQPKS